MSFYLGIQLFIIENSIHYLGLSLSIAMIGLSILIERQCTVLEKKKTFLDSICLSRKLL